MKWMDYPLVGFFSTRARGRAHRMHAKDCPCRRCDRARAAAKQELLERIPILRRILGEVGRALRPGELGYKPAPTPREELARLSWEFGELRRRVIVEVETGRMEWPPVNRNGGVRLGA